MTVWYNVCASVCVEAFGDVSLTFSEARFLMKRPNQVEKGFEAETDRQRNKERGTVSYL